MTAIEQLTTESDYRPYYSVVGPFWPIDSKTEYLEAMERMTASGYRAFGASDGEPVGFAGWYTMFSPWFDRFVWLFDLVVREDRRGMGIGTALIDECEEWARTEGCATIVLASATERSEAHRFYEERGFEHTECWFEKSLTPADGG
ncbi:GNAT family N-acetyltransferase [Halocatena halophila]|uniref:GNAT family N-acetyltransferase n=1 Tax=Halocatena halophila TaxID=2814576 RepID=UPI002ED56EAE